MNNFVRFIWVYIRNHFKRSMAIAASIVMSMFLIIGVGLLSKSADNAEVEKMKYEMGNYHVRYKDLDGSQIELIGQNNQINKLALESYYDSYNYKDKVFMNLIKADRNYIDVFGSKIIKGKYPSEIGEIALEEWVIHNLDLKPELDQDINMFLYRKNKSEKFKLVGILQDRVKHKSRGMVEGTLFLDKYADKTDAYVEFTKGADINKEIGNIAKQANIDSENIRKNLMLLEAMNQNGRVNWSIIALGMLVFIVTLIVIYSIFNISIYKRVQEYGMIRAIGGTNLQIFKIIIGELLLISAVGIPLGILTGILGAKLFSNALGSLFVEGDIHISRIIISEDIILFAVAAVLMATLSISINSYLMIKRLSPIEAIKRNYKDSIYRSKNAIGKYRIFKYLSIIKLITLRNIVRNRKNCIAIIISMSMGSALFIAAGFYGALIEDNNEKNVSISSVNSDYKVNGRITMPMNLGFSDQDINEIREIYGVKRLFPAQLLYGQMMLKDKDILDSRYFEWVNNTPYTQNVLKGLLVKDSHGDGLILKNNLWGYTNEGLNDLSDLLIDGGINIQQMNGEPIAVVRIPKPYDKPVVDIKVGDKIKVRFSKDIGEGDMEKAIRLEGEREYVYTEFIVGGITKELPIEDYFFVGDSSVDIVVSENIFKQITGFYNYRIINIDKYKDIDHKVLYDKLTTFTNAIPGTLIRDFTQEKESIQSLNQQMQLFLYGIAIVLFLISMLNIFNNVSHSMLARTSEFGMMRAIGLTQGQFKEMVIFEGLLYGLISSIIACILGIIAQFVIFDYIRASLVNPQFFVQWQSYMAVVFINIGIGLIATYFPSRSINMKSIIESIGAID